MIEKLEKQRNQEKSYEKKRTGFMVLFYFFNKKIMINMTVHQCYNLCLPVHCSHVNHKR